MRAREIETSLSITQITKARCEQWKREYSEQFDEQNFNNTLGTLRMILERGGLKGEANPATHLKRLGVKPTVLHLPETSQFDKLVETVEDAGSRHSKHCADFVRFLAFSGCRLSEARGVKWSDVDLGRGEIRVRNAKQRRTSNHAEFRYVPIIPARRDLASFPAWVALCLSFLGLQPPPFPTAEPLNKCHSAWTVPKDSPSLVAWFPQAHY